MAKGKCKECKYWNDYKHTYIKRFINAYDTKQRKEETFSRDCCSYWHIAYDWEENASERTKDCYCSRIAIVQLTLDF